MPPTSEVAPRHKLIFQNTYWILGQFLGHLQSQDDVYWKMSHGGQIKIAIFQSFCVTDYNLYGETEDSPCSKYSKSVTLQVRKAQKVLKVAQGQNMNLQSV